MKDFDPSKDYYQILCVSVNASQAEIEKMYRRQAALRHPDRGGSEDDMKALNEAHEILKDPLTRIAYDAARAAHRNPVINRHKLRQQRAQQRRTRRGMRMRQARARRDEEFFGRLIAAVTFLIVGVPFLFLVETQWMVFLWPLRILAFSMIIIGIYLAHAALRVKQRQAMLTSRRRLGRLALGEVLFWLMVSSTAYLLFIAINAL